MHGRVIPTDKELAASEGTVRPLPDRHQVFHDTIQDLVKLREPSPQQCAEVDALRKIIQLAAIYDQAGRAREGLGYSVFIKEVLDVVIDAPFNCLSAVGIACQLLDLCQRLQNETGMEMVDKTSFPVASVIPGAIWVLRL